MYAQRTIALLGFLLSAVSAQTPAGFVFTPNVTTTLNLTFGTNDIQPAGEQIPRTDTQNPPRVVVNQTLFNSSNTGILFMIDLDVVRNETRVPLLHWLVPGVTTQNGTLNIPQPSVDPNAQPKTNGTPYLQPTPPAGDAAHRYVILLFHQPQNFSFPSSFSSINPATQTSARIGFNLTQFLNDSAITNEPIAANYIQVQNNTANPSVTSFPPLSTATATSTVTAKTSSTAGANVISAAMGAAGAGVLGLAAMML